MSAAVAAGVIGATAAVGGTIASIGAQKDAAKAQAEANRASTMSVRDQLDFDMAQWEQQMQDISDLESIFGPVQENISRYYQNVTPEMYQMRGKENIERQYQRSEDAISAMFSNNGMFQSGQMVGARVALEAAREQAAGANIQESQREYLQDQSQWLSMGLNQMAAARGLATTQQGMIGQTRGQLAQTQMLSGQQMASQLGQQAQAYGQLGTGGLKLAGYALGGGFGGQTSLGNTFGGTTPTGQTFAPSTANLPKLF